MRFTLTKDELHTCWFRSQHTIEADTLEEAIEIVKNENDYHNIKQVIPTLPFKVLDPDYNNCVTLEIMHGNETVFTNEQTNQKFNKTF